MRKPKTRNRIAFVICTVVLLFGCKKKESTVEFWDPAPEQVEKAKVVAIQYARAELKVPEEILNRIKFHTFGFYKENAQVIHLEFIDPEHFPNWENFSGVLGGFPHYFTISISAKKFKIIDYYACSE